MLFVCCQHSIMIEFMTMKYLVILPRRVNESIIKILLRLLYYHTKIDKPKYNPNVIPCQPKTVVSTKTDNSNQRFLKSLAYSNHIVSILLAYTWHIKSIFRHMVSICFLYANYMLGVWEQYGSNKVRS